MSSFNKIRICPNKLTDIEYSSECLPYYDATWSSEHDDWLLSTAHLPIFVVPNEVIVNEETYLDFDKEGIQSIIPKTISLEKRLELSKKMFWIALGLDEFEKFINDTTSLEQETYICIDGVNGNSRKLLGLCKTAKRKLGSDLILMTGNISDPCIYEEYAKVGIDYVRVGHRANDVLGNLSFSKLSEFRYRRKQVAEESDCSVTRYRSIPKIIYDDECDSISDIIKALAICADYVMCEKIPYEKHELHNWVSEFVDKMAFTMSYCDAKTLDQFVGIVNYCYIE